VKPAEDFACTAIGCSSGVHLAVAKVVELDIGDLERAQAEVCRNGTCVSGPVPSVPQRNSITYGQLSPVMAEPRIELQFWRTAADGSIEIELVYEANDPQLFMDGDVYEVRLSKPGGAVLLSKAWLATNHVDSMPNGPDCEPTCRWPQSVEPL